MYYRRSRSTPVVDAGPSTGPVSAGVHRPSTFKVRHRHTGFYWTGKANNQDFYSSEGADWNSAEAAQKDIEAILSFNNGGKHARRRMEVRLQEIQHWDIVEAQVAVEVLNTLGSVSKLEDYEILKDLSQKSTLAKSFIKAMEAGRSGTMVALLHLPEPSNAFADIVADLQIPEDCLHVHRTVWEFHNYQWAVMAKLKLPSTRDFIDVGHMRQTIRDRMSRTR